METATDFDAELATVLNEEHVCESLITGGECSNPADGIRRCYLPCCGTSTQYVCLTCYQLWAAFITTLAAGTRFIGCDRCKSVKSVKVFSVEDVSFTYTPLTRS